LYRIEYRETKRWRGDTSKDADYVVGQEDDVVGSEDESGAKLIKLMFGDPIKTIHRVASAPVTVRREAVSITAKVRKEVGV